MRFSLFPKTTIDFTADPSLACDLPPVLDEISFNRPYHKGFDGRNEGYLELGQIPNPEDFGDHLENEWEEYVLKESGQDVFSVPTDCRPLVPAIKLAAAFELARGSEALIREKSCHLVVRDHLFYEDTEAQELHRDPPDIEIGRSQNTYSFSSSICTVFPGFRTPKPFEMVCFTAGASHHRPEIKVLDRAHPLRRVFVAIAFNCYFKVDNLFDIPDPATNGRHFN